MSAVEEKEREQTGRVEQLSARVEELEADCGGYKDQLKNLEVREGGRERERRLVKIEEEEGRRVRIDGDRRGGRKEGRKEGRERFNGGKERRKEKFMNRLREGEEEERVCGR